MITEINFDGLVGPSHNYAGLSLGNIASASNAGAVSAPRKAALQGLAKMRRMLELGLPQGVLPPHPRPHVEFLRAMGFGGDDAAVIAAAARAEPALLRNAFSASAMWTANAATVSPAPDTADGRCHFTVANLSTMLHRSIEPEHTLRQLRLAFADTRHFAVHAPVPAALGDEGAANAMRLCADHGAPGLEVLVYGEQARGDFPARQHRAAFAAIARRHGLAPAATLLAQQNPAAIAAGAFHNDVVAVANEQVLFTHEQAFADRAGVQAFIASRLPGAVIIEAPADRISLEAAVRSYLFNSMLVTLPGEQGMALVLPAEARETPEVWAWLQELVAGNGPIRHLEVVDLRESMRNGGGPACLRLRVALSPEAHAAIDPRFLLDAPRIAMIERVVEAHWPEAIAPDDLANPDLWRQCIAARAALLAAMGFAQGEL